MASCRRRRDGLARYGQRADSKPAARLSGAAVVATGATISVISDAFRLALFGGYALMDMSTVVTGTIIGMITIPGSYCAKWLRTRMSARLHIAVIEGMLLIAAIWLMASALRG